MKNNNFIVSIVVCTFNGKDRIPPTLESLLTLDIDRDATDVIIVDNNSTDGTREVVLDFINRQESLNARYVFEEKQGLSHARNRGVEESRGDIVVFLDDDVIPQPGWIVALLEVYEREENVGCVGGEVLLDLSHIELPSWFGPSLEPVLSRFSLDKGDIHECEDFSEFPIGSNFSFLRAALEKCGPFETSIGVGSMGLNTGEDTEMCIRLKDNGFRIFYQPKAVVNHNIEGKRINKEYFRKRADALGPKLVLYEISFKKVAPPLFLLIHLMTCLVYSGLLYLRFWKGESDRFFHYLRIRTYLNALRYCLYLMKSREKIVEDATA